MIESKDSVENPIAKAMPPSTEPPKKIIVAVHGIGDQFQLHSSISDGWPH